MNWDPLHELVALHERAQQNQRAPAPDTTWVPNVDLLETATHYLIVAEVPGVAAGHFHIQATPDRLVLSGQRSSATPSPPHYLRMERGHGRFARAFTFAEAIVVGDITATLDHGLLSISIPKASASGDRRIAIE